MLPPLTHMPVVMRLERNVSGVTYTSMSNCVGRFICSFLGLGKEMCTCFLYFFVRS